MKFKKGTEINYISIALLKTLFTDPFLFKKLNDYLDYEDVKKIFY